MPTTASQDLQAIILEKEKHLLEKLIEYRHEIEFIYFSRYPEIGTLPVTPENKNNFSVAESISSEFKILAWFILTMINDYEYELSANNELSNPNAYLVYRFLPTFFSTPNAKILNKKELEFDKELLDIIKEQIGNIPQFKTDVPCREFQLTIYNLIHATGNFLQNLYSIQFLNASNSGKALQKSLGIFQSCLQSITVDYVEISSLYSVLNKVEKIEEEHTLSAVLK